MKFSNLSWFIFVYKIFYFLSIKAQDYHVKDFNATGDGITDDTNAVRATLAAAYNSNGGRVIFDEGYSFLTGAFNVTSNIILEVRGTLLASQESDEFHYPLIPRVPWQGSPGQVERNSFIQSKNASNITLTGGGIIDGQGGPWWICSYDLALSPCNGIQRPVFVRFIWSSNIIVHDITLKDSPAWMLYLSWVTTAHIYNVNLTTPPLPIAHNTDGMDIDCSVDVLIENCHYQGSDDAVTMAAGANGLGRKYGRTTENILVRNFTIFNSTNSAMSIGSETSAGIRNVTYENIFANGTGAAARIKTNRIRGGLVENITWNNFTAYNVVDGGVVFTAVYGGTAYNYTTDDATPKFKNIRVTNLYVDGGNNGWHVIGLPESPFRVYFENITVKNINNTTLFTKCGSVDGYCDSSSVLPSCPPCMNKGCPTNWSESTVNKQECYRIHNTTLSWSDAQNFCQTSLLLTSLTSIDSAFQNRDIVNLIKSTYPNCQQAYVGLQRNGSSWTWINGDNSTYQNWGANYPSNDPNADCGVLNVNDGTWKNQDCSIPQCYICSFNINEPY